MFLLAVMGHYADSTALREALDDDFASGAAVMLGSALTETNSGQGSSSASFFEQP